MTKQNKFINAEIPVANKEQAEAAAKKAEELGYGFTLGFGYSDKCNYLTLCSDGSYSYHISKASVLNILPLSDFLHQPRTETITLDNGEKWRVQLIEKVEEEPMSAEEFYYANAGGAHTTEWMERYANYRLEFERKKLTPQ